MTPKRWRYDEIEMSFFQQSPREQVAVLRRLLPLAIFLLVIIYQLLFVRRLHEFGAVYHYGVEILFYGLVGPIATWSVLAWIERQLKAKEEAQARAQRERLRRERAVREERARIAREIHEGVAQNLYFLGLQLDVAKKLAHDRPERVEEELTQLRTLLSESIADLRRLIWALRPVELEELGPIEAIRRLCSDLASKLDLDVDVTVEGTEQRFKPELEGTLYRVVQESLNNVAKHAEAEHAWVTFDVRNGQIETEIGDDGRGFDVDVALRDGDGLGLRHLRERVEEHGGDFSIDSSADGSRVRATLPLNPDDTRGNDR